MGSGQWTWLDADVPLARLPRQLGSKPVSFFLRIPGPLAKPPPTFLRRTVSALLVIGQQLDKEVAFAGTASHWPSLCQGSGAGFLSLGTSDRRTVSVGHSLLGGAVVCSVGDVAECLASSIPRLSLPRIPWGAKPPPRENHAQLHSRNSRRRLSNLRSLPSLFCRLTPAYIPTGPCLRLSQEALPAPVPASQPQLQGNQEWSRGAWSFCLSTEPAPNVIMRGSPWPKQHREPSFVPGTDSALSDSADPF